MTDSMTKKQDKPGPLEGVRILEYGVFHAGPGATAILGDLGADIVKIEEADGDPERFWTSVGKTSFARKDGTSIMFDASNRNKRGIWLDISTEKGREIFHKLVKNADVFLTNLRKTTKAKMGLDYATLSKVNPQIIHANVSGYGPEGPLSDRGAFDPLGMAQSGMMYLTGNTEPEMLHIGILDQATAITASHAIVTALFYRERHGIGQEVHVSLYSSGLWLTYLNQILTNILKKDPNIRSDRSEHSPLRNRYRCKDGKWVMGTHHPEDKYWRTICEVMGRTDLRDDPRYADAKSRLAYNSELVAIFDEIFATKTRDEWMQIFLGQGLMFCPIQHAHEIKDDPQALINGYMVDYEDSFFGKLKIPGYPAHFSANQAGTRSFGPAIGQHTDMVMRELGFTDQEIEGLKQEGVIR